MGKGVCIMGESKLKTNKNMNQTASAVEVKETILNSRISILFNQLISLETHEKDIYQVIDRLSCLGFRTNGTDHPSNMPKPESINNAPNAPQSPKSISDGIVGRLDILIERNEDIINRLNNSIYKSMINNIEYLEQHI